MNSYILPQSCASKETQTKRREGESCAGKESIISACDERKSNEYEVEKTFRDNISSDTIICK